MRFAIVQGLRSWGLRVSLARGGEGARGKATDLLLVKVPRACPIACPPPVLPLLVEVCLGRRRAPCSTRCGRACAYGHRHIVVSGQPSVHQSVCPSSHLALLFSGGLGNQAVAPSSADSHHAGSVRYSLRGGAGVAVMVPREAHQEATVC